MGMALKSLPQMGISLVPCACTCLRRARALEFQAGGIVLFIHWRGGAERQAGFGPSFWTAAPAIFFLGNWPRRPSWAVGFANRGIATAR